MGPLFYLHSCLLKSRRVWILPYYIDSLHFLAIQRAFYIRLEDVPRSTPGYWKVLDPIRAKMKLAIMKLNNKIIASMVCIQKLSKELFRS